MSGNKKTAEELLAEEAKKDPEGMNKLDKEIEKAEKKGKKKAEKIKVEVKASDLKKAIKESDIGEILKWVPRTKRIALKFKGIAVFYVHDTPQGIHHFKRSKGTRLESGYLATQEQMDTFLAKLVKEVELLHKEFEAEQKEAKEEKSK